MIKFLAHKGHSTLISSTGFTDIPARTPVGVDLAVINGGSFNGFINSGILRMFQTAEEAWTWINSDRVPSEPGPIVAVDEVQVQPQFDTKELLGLIPAVPAGPSYAYEEPVQVQAQPEEPVESTVVPEPVASAEPAVEAPVDETPVEPQVEVATEPFEAVEAVAEPDAAASPVPAKKTKAK